MDSVCFCVFPYIGDQCGSLDEKEREERYSNIATGFNYVVASSSSWSNSIWNPETGSTRIRGSEGYFLLSKMRTLKACTYLPNGQAYEVSIWLVGNVWSRIPLLWNLGGRVQWKSSSRKVTQIPALGGLTLEFPWDPCEGLGFKPLHFRLENISQ